MKNNKLTQNNIKNISILYFLYVHIIPATNKQCDWSVHMIII